MTRNALDYWHEAKPRCPHCGDRFEVWDNDNPLSLNYDDGGHTTITCDHCSKEFVCVTTVKYSFSTAVSEEAADDEEWGPQEADAS